MNGDIIKISRFCTDDGPGIRTTVFLKGCPLSCIWCHNPESQKKTPEIMYDSKKCVGCMSCLVCPQNCHTINENGHVFNKENCLACGRCVEKCPVKALSITGRNVSAEEVFKEIKKDTVFYETSGGGVTISGGEPLFCPEFTIEILKQCREECIHTAIETSGFASETTLKSVLDFCDFVLFDIKETDDEKHKSFTGVPLLPILKNLNIVNDSGVPFVIRLPIIPGLNDREKHFESVRKIAESMQYCKGIEVMPYHLLGAYKYEMLGREYLLRDIKEPDEETINKWRKNFK